MHARGDSTDQLLGKSVCPFIIPDYGQPFREMTEAVLRGESRRLEFEIVGANGTRRWLDSHTVPLTNASGEITSSLGITRDITESKRAEEALRQIPLDEIQRRKLKTVKHLGIIFGLSIVVFVAAGRFELFEAFSRWVLTLKETALDELLTVVLFLTFASAFFSYRKWKDLKIEVTARKNAEETLRALHSELERRVQERTVDLAKSNDGLRAEVAERKKAQSMVQVNLERIQALHEIDTAISSTLDLRTVLDVLLEKIELFLPIAAATTVRLLNRETGELDSLACRGLDEHEWSSVQQTMLSGRARKTVETKAPVVVRDIRQTYNPEIFVKQGLVSYLGVRSSLSRQS
jgi:hypothetical protein